MTTTPEELRAWARGVLPVEAATELLLRAFSGRFAEPGWPWMIRDEAYGHRLIDFDAIPVHVEGLSGGERQFLLIAASLGGNCPLILNDALPGLDRALLDLVLAASAHAAGSHHDSIMVEDRGGPMGFDRVDTLHPWPQAAPALRVIDGGQS
ncbi:hypothetical protein [Arthrobacter sp. UYCo732]|uniref:hypothetical protein n=1 Tax=Arthrobacter sp. UYCo732 TaxID=3156336 RepID=UPI0033967EA8